MNEPSQIKKITITPENMGQSRLLKANNISSTPKSITSAQSLHMKSENLNRQPSTAQKNQKNKMYTPLIKQLANQKNPDKIFRKKTESG